MIRTRDDPPPPPNGGGSLIDTLIVLKMKTIRVPVSISFSPNLQAFQTPNSNQIHVSGSNIGQQDR